MPRILALLALTFFLVVNSAATEVSTAAHEAAAERSSLRWTSKSISIALSSSLQRAPYLKDGSDVEGALRRSLQAWEMITGVRFVIVNSDKQSVSAAGQSGDGVSLITIAATPENVLLFSRDPENVAATTRVFYNGKGAITEADIVLNPYQQFSTDGTFGSFDLESTLTHEIGHLLGLEHSLVPGATMSENYGRNGVYNLAGFGSRTLSMADIAAARALYAGPGDAVECCGRITGRLSQSANRPTKGAFVWLEAAGSGALAGRQKVQRNGGFEFAGVPYGRYRLFAERPTDDKSGFGGHMVAELTVDKAEIDVGTKQIVSAPPAVHVSLVGFNGQLSDLPVMLNAGRSYTFFIAGRNLDPDRIRVGFNSPHLTVTPASVRKHDYGLELDVLSFELNTDSRSPSGEYSLFVQVGDSRSYFVGALTLDSFVNPFGIHYTLAE